MTNFKSFIDSFKKQISIADVISKHTQLKKRNGGKYIGKCPLHKDDTPSFTVDDVNGVFYCFGCLKGGDVIKFTEELYGLSFNDALQSLAGQYSIALPSFSRQDGEAAAQQKSKETIALQTLKQACKIANKVLHQSLIGNEAMTYLTKQRGFSEAIVNEFAFGLVSDGFESAAKQEGITQSELNLAGIYMENYNRFSGRIIVPIHNKNAEIVGFGGRIYGNNPAAKQTAKYINSPETVVFKKNEVLFNYHRVRLQKASFIIVVEGYFDVIKLWQHGIKNAVAPMGTNITEDHLATLFKSSKDLIFCFDGDNAGIAASLRAMKMCFKFLTSDTSCKFMTLPSGVKDPDEMLDQYGKEGFLALFSKSANSRTGCVVDIKQAFFYAITQGLDLKNADHRTRVQNEIKLNVISQIKDPLLAKNYHDFFKFELDRIKFTKADDVQKEIYGSQSKNKAQDAMLTKFALGGGKIVTQGEKVIRAHRTSSSQVQACQNKILSALVSNAKLLFSHKDDVLEYINIDILEQDAEQIYQEIISQIEESSIKNLNPDDVFSLITTKFYKLFNHDLICKTKDDFIKTLQRLQIGLAIITAEAKIAHLKQNLEAQDTSLTELAGLIADLTELKLSLSKI